MTRYVIADREYQYTEHGVKIWVIPGRAIVTATIRDSRTQMPTKNGRSAAITHLLDYLAAHPPATVRMMITGRFRKDTLTHALKNNPHLFEPAGTVARYGAQLWKLREEKQCE